MLVKVLLWCGKICHVITHIIAITAAKHQSDFELTKDTPYLTLTGEIWGVYCENLEKIGYIITASHCMWYNISNLGSIYAYHMWPALCYYIHSHCLGDQSAFSRTQPFLAPLMWHGWLIWSQLGVTEATEHTLATGFSGWARKVHRLGIQSAHSNT